MFAQAHSLWRMLAATRWLDIHAPVSGHPEPGPLVHRRPIE